MASLLSIKVKNAKKRFGYEISLYDSYLVTFRCHGTLNSCLLQWVAKKIIKRGLCTMCGQKRLTLQTTISYWTCMCGKKTLKVQLQLYSKHHIPMYVGNMYLKNVCPMVDHDKLCKRWYRYINMYNRYWLIVYIKVFLKNIWKYLNNANISLNGYILPILGPSILIRMFSLL